MNFDNAISDTVETHPDFVGYYAQVADTPENEPCWVVKFERIIPNDMSARSGMLTLEVILRDGGIVASLLEHIALNLDERTNLLNTFLNCLEIIPE